MAELSTTYIGHQSWMVSTESTHILIDPVLTRGFGFSEHLEFTVFPHREVLVDRLPAIAAVVLTNEHLDHFHIPSLKLLPPTVQVYLPDTAPAVVFDTLDRLSLRHYALRDAEARFARFFHNTPVAISTIARDGRIGSMNASFIDTHVLIEAGWNNGGVSGGTVHADRKSVV